MAENSENSNVSKATTTVVSSTNKTETKPSNTDHNGSKPPARTSYNREGGYQRRYTSSRGTGSRNTTGISSSVGSANGTMPARTDRKPFGDRNRNVAGANRNRGKFNRPPRKEEEESSLQSTVITVKRITRVVKGGKRMRFAALVVAGDKAGSIGFGFKKGLDYQDAVKKATKQAGKNLLKVKLNEDKSVDFPTTLKFKAANIFLKPAKIGTGLIAGGFIRPVLELAGIENIYSKIIGSRNKVTGVQATFEALKKYS